MQLVPIEAIFVPENRQREDFDPEAQAELGKSIQDLGLMHPIVVTPSEGEQPWRLVAGERRLRCFSEFSMLDTEVRCGNSPVPPGMVPVLTLGDLDELDREEAELDENIKRADLTWQERAAATARVMSLRERQASRDGTPRPTAADIAAEVQSPLRSGFEGDSGAEVTRTKRQLIVARQLDNPDVAKAKTLDDAYKIIVKADEAKRNEAIALAVGKVYSAADHILHHGDCALLDLATVGQGFDILITDPPYGMGAHEFGDSGGRIEETHDYKDDAGAFTDFLLNLPRLSGLCKDAAHAYIFCDVDGFHKVRQTLAACGWSAFRTPIIMHKLNSGRVPIPDFGPRRQYELVAFAYRGGKRVTGVYSDVFQTTVDEALGHGAQKPVEAYTNLLTRSCRPGERILDPYCGTGTVFAAATHLKLYATGVEKSAATYAIALKRLEGLKT